MTCAFENQLLRRQHSQKAYIVWSIVISVAEMNGWKVAVA